MKESKLNTLLLNNNKEVTIDLNNHNISAPNTTIRVQGAKLTLKGKGTVQEDVPYYGAILIKGSGNEEDKNYSVVNVGKDVTLTGWTGIFLDQLSGKAYGVVVNCDCIIKSVQDSTGVKGSGIYLNGSVKHIENAPVINLTSNSKVSSEGNGIYAAGYGIWNIDGATINGSEAGLGIKSGVFKLKNVNVTSNGEDVRPTEGWGNGINPSGSAIQIESNKGYAGKIDLTINGGTYTSKNGAATYEYLDSKETSVGVSNAKETENTLLNSLENNKELAEKTKNTNTKIEVVIDNNVTINNELENKIKDFLNKKLKDAVLADTFDISIAVTNKDNNNKIGNITELTDKIEMTVMLSEKLRDIPEGYTRKYYIMREHNSEIELLDADLTENKLGIKFKTDKFSTYGITYVDTKIEETNNGNTSSSNPKTGDNIVAYISIFAFSVVGIAIMKKANVKRGRHFRK